MDDQESAKMIKQSMPDIVYTPELLAMYQRFLSDAAMMERIKEQTSPVPNVSLDTSSTATALDLGMEIPREEIECDPENIIVKNVIDTLQKFATNLDGYDVVKGYAGVVTKVSARPMHLPISQNLKLPRRNRRSMESSLSTQLNEKCHADDATTTKDSAQDVSAPLKKMEIDSLEDRMVQIRLDRLRLIHLNRPKPNIDSIQLVYHDNMRRHFPGAELRTEEQKLRRAKNTLAARVSRCKNQAYEKILHEQSMQAVIANLELKRKIACAKDYCTLLMTQLGYPKVDLNEMWEKKLCDVTMGEKKAPAEQEQQKEPGIKRSRSTESLDSSLQREQEQPKEPGIKRSRSTESLDSSLEREQEQPKEPGIKRSRSTESLDSSSSSSGSSSSSICPMTF